MVDWPIARGNWFMRINWTRMYIEKSLVFVAITIYHFLWMTPLIIADRFPFIANVDPLKKAQYRSLEELSDPIKVVIYMGAHEELVDEIIERIEKTNKAHIRYHAHEKCIYLNPANTHKATTVEELCGENFVAFGNDQNDIELFEKALYAVQIGDFPALQPYADDQLVAKQNQPQAVAAKILQVFAEFRGK